MSERLSPLAAVRQARGHAQGCRAREFSLLRGLPCLPVDVGMSRTEGLAAKLWNEAKPLPATPKRGPKPTKTGARAEPVYRRRPPARRARQSPPIRVWQRWEK